MRSLLWLVWLIFLGLASAGNPDRIPVPLIVTNDVGVGNEVYMVGSHPDAGAWDPIHAIRMRWTSGNVWVGQVGLPAGTDLAYKYISRSSAPENYCNGANVVWEAGDDRNLSVPDGWPPPEPGKTIYYYSGWTSASLVTVTATGFPVYPMTPVGPGRVPGETLFKVEGIGESGASLEFVPNGWLGGENFWDNSSDPQYQNNYVTDLDVFLLQDGQIYSYWPAAGVSPPRVISNFVNSSISGITGRLIRIYLPRGYDDHFWKRYPVIYFQDGTNVFSPGGSFGSWDADLTATREISQGRMREALLVAIDNMPNRRSEYNPHTDTYPNEPPGQADTYLRFLVDNVRPTLDFNFRTLNDQRNTLVAGSSMGGIFSVYAGYETNVFGGVLAMSPSFTRAPKYTAALWGRSKHPLRIYMDTGNAEGQVGIQPGGDYWQSPWEGYDILLNQGYTPNRDLLMRIGCGHGHNEAAWRERLPTALRFLLAARDEANLLAQVEWAPDLREFQIPGTIFVPTQAFLRYRLEGSTGGLWYPESEWMTETNAWGRVSLVATSSVIGVKWFRVATEP